MWNVLTFSSFCSLNIRIRKIKWLSYFYWHSIKKDTTFIFTRGIQSLFPWFPENCLNYLALGIHYNGLPRWLQPRQEIQEICVWSLGQEDPLEEDMATHSSILAGKIPGTVCSLPGSSVHGISQARVLEWIAISFSRGSSWPRNRTLVSCIAGRRFTIWATFVIHPLIFVFKKLSIIPEYSRRWP